MKIAFLIIAHREPGQLARLCRHLGEHDVYVHLDAKVDIAPYLAATHGGKVRFVERRTSVSWGGYSMVEATTELIDCALASGTGYGKLVLLSGSCYPIKPVSELARRFLADGDSNYVSTTPIQASDPALYKLISRHWYLDGFCSARTKASFPGFDALAARLAGKLSEYFPREPKSKLGAMQPYFGSQWWAITSECAAFVSDQLRNNRTLVDYYRTVYAPDEHVVQTLIANSRFSRHPAGLVANQGTSTNRQAPLHWIHPSEARQFTDRDDVAALRASPHFFIRKVSGDATELLDSIDRQLLATDEPV